MMAGELTSGEISAIQPDPGGLALGLGLRRSVQEQHAITQHRTQFLHPAEQFDALAAAGVAQALDHGGQIYPDGLDRILQRAAFVDCGALRLARAANFSKVDDLRHKFIV